jgi:hypothetical protein
MLKTYSNAKIELREKEFEAKIDEKFGISSEERHTILVIQCVNTTSQGELS